MLINPHIIAINMNILWKTIQAGSWFKLQHSWCRQKCGSNLGLGTKYPESLCGFPQSVHETVRTVQVALVLHLLAIMPLANLYHFLLYALSFLLQQPLVGYTPGSCHTCKNKTGRLCTHCKLHVTMHSSFTSDHRHKFKPRDLFVSFFLSFFLCPYFSFFYLQISQWHTKLRNKGWNDDQ